MANVIVQVIPKLKNSTLNIKKWQRQKSKINGGYTH